MNSSDDDSGDAPEPGSSAPNARAASEIVQTSTQDERDTRAIHVKPVPLPRLPAGSDDEEYRRVRGNVESTEDKALRRFERLEELSFAAESKQLLNLSWLLRAKHARAHVSAARERADQAKLTRHASWFVNIAALIAFAGWASVVWLFLSSSSKIPDAWELLVATSGAVLLFTGLATLLFKAALRFQGASSERAAEADTTRKIEAAVRLILGSDILDSSGVADDGARKALVSLALELVKSGDGKDKVEADLSALPDAIKEVAEVVIK